MQQLLQAETLRRSELLGRRSAKHVYSSRPNLPAAWRYQARGLRTMAGGAGLPSVRSATPTGDASLSLIQRLQEEFSHLKLEVPTWAEAEWSKDEARLFFETQGLVKPIRKHLAPCGRLEMI